MPLDQVQFDLIIIIIIITIHRRERMSRIDKMYKIDKKSHCISHELISWARLNAHIHATCYN